LEGRREEMSLEFLILFWDPGIGRE